MAKVGDSPVEYVNNIVIIKGAKGIINYTRALVKELGLDNNYIYILYSSRY